MRDSSLDKSETVSILQVRDNAASKLDDKSLLSLCDP